MLLQTVQDLDLNRQDDVELSKSENSYLGSNKLDELYLGVCCSILDELQLQKEKAKLKHTYACRRMEKKKKRRKRDHVPSGQRRPKLLTNGGKVS